MNEIEKDIFVSMLWDKYTKSKKQKDHDVFLNMCCEFWGKA